VQHRKVDLEIWDTGGQEVFRSLVRNYYRDVAGVVAVADLTRIDSLTDVEFWLHEIRENCGQDVALLMIGNKVDLVSERTVSVDEAEQFANKYQIPYIETSAKTAANVTNSFTWIAAMILARDLSPVNRPVMAPLERERRCC
jgi:small GTP-binding protein